MSRDVSSFIKDHVKSHLTISKAIDEKYVTPMVKVWKEYDIGKQEIVLLGMAIGYKLEKEKRLKEVVDCENALEKKGGTADLGNIKAFEDSILTFILGISIAKYGVDETISRFPEILNELEKLSEKGVMYLYCSVEWIMQPSLHCCKSRRFVKTARLHFTFAIILQEIVEYELLNCLCA